MKILDIYKKYNIPENLQMHMLRVAACTNIIIDNWNGIELNKEAIIKVSLLHDMGNIIKSRIYNNNSYNIDDSTIDYYINKYGTDDHYVTYQICKELGFSDYELYILNNKVSKENEKIMKCDSFEIKICAYCDERVSPYGVLSIINRLNDAKERYKGKNDTWGNPEVANHLIDCAIEIEKQIFKYCNIKPEDINDNSIKGYIDKLKEYEIRD